MKLTLTGEVWQEADRVGRNWLPGYVRAKFDETVTLLRQIGLNTPVDAWERYQGTLTINIHRTYDWGNSGLYTPLGAVGFDNPNARDQIDISWDLEMQAKEVLAHELRHFLALYSGDPKSGDIGHGTSDDAIVKYLKLWIGRVYHGDLHLRHVRDLNTDF